MTDLGSSQIQTWLHDGDSFMKRLKRHGLQPRVQVLKQGWEYPLDEEQDWLALPPRRYVFVREVEICEGKQALMFARTAIPAATLTGSERLLAQLGTRSLGSVLFSYTNLERTPFQVRQCLLPQYSSDLLWERQSVFLVRAKPLVLTEVFLPPLLDIISAYED